MTTRLTFEEAKKLGMDACVDRLGRDFVMRYRDTSCPGYGDIEERVYCFPGVNNSADRYEDKAVMLNGGDPWSYPVKCTVRYEDGKVVFLKCIVPQS